MNVKRRRKDGAWGTLKRGKQIEARSSWHLHIEKEEIGCQLKDQIECFSGTPRLADDLDIGMGGQQTPQFRSSAPMVPPGLYG